jgi:drug/metabolite transporter (DMT)-like permease
MSSDEHAITITFYFMLTSMLCALATVPWGWVVPNQQQTIALLLLGLFGVFGQLLLTYSYRYAEASTIAPLDYTNMIMSVTLGYWIFDELPSWSIWAGVPLVIASGLIIFWREYRLQQHHRRQLALVAE